MLSGIGGVVGRVGSVLEVLLSEEEDEGASVERNGEERENEERENEERMSSETTHLVSVWLPEEDELNAVALLAVLGVDAING